MRCEKKLHWVHVASSQLATLYTIHAKRGQEAMDEADILPQFKGSQSMIIGFHTLLTNTLHMDYAMPTICAN